MKLNTNSNTYTLLYASGVVIVVVFLLAFVSMALKERSDANERIDRQKQILSSLGIHPAAGDVESTYRSVVKSDPIVNEKGEDVKAAGGFDVKRSDISADQLPVFICEKDGTTKYVIPLVGKGLWGSIWGYLALDADGETVYGAYFNHESETAGLGALIAESSFQEEFHGKKLHSADGTPLSVVKNGSKKEDAATQCDGISGATLTSNGVNNMLHDYIQLYSSFLSTLK